jgi:hypothetical protein
VKKKSGRPSSTAPKRKRRPPTKATEVAVLSKCRRRCALCYTYDDKDLADLQGQLAHISKDRSDSSEENLVYLCLRHHDSFDSTRSQSKGITEGELRKAKERVEEYISLNGRHGTVQSRVAFERDATPFTDSDCAKLLQQMKDIAEVTGTISVKGITAGGTTLQVEMDANDVARLVRAYHRGDLAELQVESVTVSVIDRHREVGYCRGVGIDRTLSFTEEIAVQLFREAEFFQDFALKNHRGILRVAAKQNPFYADFVTISCGYAGLSRVDLIEPIILDKRKMTINELNQPLELLRRFLELYGLTIQSPGGAERSKLFVDRKFSYFSTLPPDLAAGAMIARILPSIERDSAGTSSIHFASPFSVYFVVLFAVNAQEREYQVHTWKNSRWV